MLCTAPAGTGSGMCRNANRKRNSKTRSSLCEQHTLNRNNQRVPLFSPPAARTNFLMRRAGFGNSICYSFFSFLQLNPKPLLSSYLCLLLLILSLSLSPSPSPRYSHCHPHRTSQKCADSGCWATLPYYWSFKWKPSRAVSDWLALQRGGTAAMLYDHTSL